MLLKVHLQFKYHDKIKTVGTISEEAYFTKLSTNIPITNHCSRQQFEYKTFPNERSLRQMSESQQNDLERLEREINKLAMVSTVNKVLIKSIMFRYSILITHFKKNCTFCICKLMFYDIWARPWIHKHMQIWIFIIESMWAISNYKYDLIL